MPKCGKWPAVALALAACMLLGASPGQAGVPDVTQSFYVPQIGPVGSPTEGDVAVRSFRACPNNDGGTSLPNSARIKVVVRDVNGLPIEGIASADICLLFNGGTLAQGFSGAGADSIIANSTWNQLPLCPDVRCVSADAPTDASGTTYITFTGADQANPGVGVRNANRKWGHYDTEIPVFVLGFKIPGFKESARLNPYTLRIKNMDLAGGLGAALNQGEAVNFSDYVSVVSGTAGPNALNYWRDVNGDGLLSFSDVVIMAAHYLHDCDTPNSP